MGATITDVVYSKAAKFKLTEYHYHDYEGMETSH